MRLVQKIGVLFILAAFCSGCELTAPPAPDMAPLTGDPCAGWGCATDADCPPTLCIDATKHGRCESGTCSWRIP